MLPPIQEEQRDMKREKHKFHFRQLLEREIYTAIQSKISHIVVTCYSSPYCVTLILQKSRPICLEMLTKYDRQTIFCDACNIF